jgi:hypothetical protein
MNKILISLLTMIFITLSSIASADVKISGFMQQIMGMGDETDGGITSKFTRFTMGADTTTDNGWTVGGSFTLSVQALLSGSADSYLPSSNSIYIQTDMGTFTIGQNADAATSLIPRAGAMVPGDGHDGYYVALFDSGITATSDTGWAEVYYAQASDRITYALPVVNGFSVSVSYTPDIAFNSGTTNARNQSDESAVHGEVVHLAAAYEAEIDGISYVLGVASISGNSIGTASTYGANDLSAVTAGVKATMGNITLGVHAYDHGESFGRTGDAAKASDAGYTFAMEYGMGNLTFGAGYAHQEKVVGGASSNVLEDTNTYFGLGYNLGGGVNTWAQLSNMDHSDGDHATIEADPQILMAGISLGF